MLCIWKRENVCPSQGCNKRFKMKSRLKRHIEEHVWDHITCTHGSVLVSKYALNGCPYTTHHRSSWQCYKEYCEFKPFSRVAKEDKNRGNGDKDGDDGGDDN